MTRSVWMLFCSPPNQGRLSGAGVIDELAAQAIASWPTLAIPQLDEAALADEHLPGKFSAVLLGHDAFHVLDDVGPGAAIVLKLFSAVVDLYPRLLADALSTSAHTRRLV